MSAKVTSKKTRVVFFAMLIVPMTLIGAVVWRAATVTDELRQAVREQIAAKKADSELAAIEAAKQSRMTAIRQDARFAVQRAARDPDSVKFGPIGVVLSPHEAVCGTFNARNGFGGMTGETRFLYLPEGNGLLVDEGARGLRDIFASGWSKFCNMKNS